ncbi:MAG: NINE protein [Bifidobacterium tibiigranuli]|jgi:TM2 domain-containing membrane protein YozV|uniref:TM2 domain-containing protein n=1 Tax=Bifidobacterium tibiigranuli TaxID=2172043 RepID=UPI002354924F|nr:TM2 domain-containing protein [Bifidobacterium tibiigranuli]MCH3973872.1 NINE protein [Bifidobacterium tibiigranuli]MCH4189348.1 NINE protein [Bifidobacterium tibiigranuli]MCH4203867.1 NINE protein [Bifidobacterium tibiigranuli]MCH4274291.1 NINE protein [Bifidobacterium tibiigranuli]MCI1791486.1 NINE protein [Bifidobacterium tibiigranuli]
MSDFNPDNGQQQYPSDSYAQTPQAPVGGEQPTQPTQPSQPAQPAQPMQQGQAGQTGQQQYAAAPADPYGYAGANAGPNTNPNAGQPQYAQQPYDAYQGAYYAPGQDGFEGGFAQGGQQGQPGQQWGAQPYSAQGYAGPELPYGYIPRQKLVAGLLGIFLGSFGVHNFYLGNTGKAVAQLLLTLVGWIIVVGPFVAWVWGLIEGILILCSNYGSPWHRDARGVELRD